MRGYMISFGKQWSLLFHHLSCWLTRKGYTFILFVFGIKDPLMTILVTSKSTFFLWSLYFYFLPPIIHPNCLREIFCHHDRGSKEKQGRTVATYFFLKFLYDISNCWPFLQLPFQISVFTVFYIKIPSEEIEEIYLLVHIQKISWQLFQI